MIADHNTNETQTAQVMGNIANAIAPTVLGHDQRDLPEADMCQNAISDITDILTGLLANTRMAGELDNILWQLTNVFHRRMTKLDAAFDEMVYEIRQAIPQQDGSEIKSQQLEDLTDNAKETQQYRDVFETLRDAAADSYGSLAGRTWLPSTGSRVSLQTTTASALNVSEYLKAVKDRRLAARTPEGPRVLVSGDTEWTDINTVYTALSRTRDKNPNMVIVHGGANKGLDVIASTWATRHNVPQIICQPDWKKHGKGAGFKRNDVMLRLDPIGLLTFGGKGGTLNLIDKAKKQGVEVRKYT